MHFFAFWYILLRTELYDTGRIETISFQSKFSKMQLKCSQNAVKIQSKCSQNAAQNAVEMQSNAAEMHLKFSQN